MKTRRHHNNKGTTQINRGKVKDRVERLAKILRISYKRENWKARLGE